MPLDFSRLFGVCNWHKHIYARKHRQTRLFSHSIDIRHSFVVVFHAVVGLCIIHCSTHTIFAVSRKNCIPESKTETEKEIRRYKMSVCITRMSISSPPVLKEVKYFFTNWWLKPVYIIGAYSSSFMRRFATIKHTNTSLNY